MQLLTDHYHLEDKLDRPPPPPVTAAGAKTTTVDLADLRQHAKGSSPVHKPPPPVPRETFRNMAAMKNEWRRRKWTPARPNPPSRSHYSHLTIRYPHSGLWAKPMAVAPSGADANAPASVKLYDREADVAAVTALPP